MMGELIKDYTADLQSSQVTALEQLEASSAERSEWIWQACFWGNDREEEKRRV